VRGEKESFFQEAFLLPHANNTMTQNQSLWQAVKFTLFSISAGVVELVTE